MMNKSANLTRISRDRKQSARVFIGMHHIHSHTHTYHSRYPYYYYIVLHKIMIMMIVASQMRYKQKSNQLFQSTLLESLIIEFFIFPWINSKNWKFIKEFKWKKTIEIKINDKFRTIFFFFSYEMQICERKKLANYLVYHHIVLLLITLI